MNSQGLDRQARQRLEKIIRGQLSFLDCFTGLMHQKMFPHDDPLRLAAENARATMQRLHEVAKKLADTRE